MSENKLRYNIVDYSGRRFGRLLVIKCIESTSKKEGRGKWLCKCDCGKDHIVNGTAFTKKGAKSCGCAQKEAQRKMAKGRRRPDIVTITAQYCTHKNKGSKKGLGYLSKQEWECIVFQPCYYCGEMDIRNNLLYSNSDAKNTFTEEEIRQYDKQINGIDRIDSTKGYTVDNCRPCCTQCNTLKMDYTEEEFYEKIEKILSHRIYRELDIQSFIIV